MLREILQRCLEPTLIGCSATTSACGKGEQWEKALALLREMLERCLEPTEISYSATTSACGEGERWEEALELLWGGEPDQPQCSRWCVRGGWALGLAVRLWAAAASDAKEGSESLLGVPERCLKPNVMKPNVMKQHKKP